MLKHNFMHKIILLFIPVLMLLLIGTLQAEKITVQRVDAVQPPKIHPFTSLLSAQSERFPANKKASNYERLLVILVDFQEESPDDPFTTGKGKFLLEQDPTYRTTVGSPPHDQNYFLANLEALRFYYSAASQNSFNLQYDLFPVSGPAYTLPHTMSYYNPVGASSDLFVQRIQEYFKAAFELADSLTPAIDFSSYSHFMIIHAGSDWQHDLAGNTPCDLPSFFIKVPPGKEALVDNGSVLISHACNVPSTISQDFDSYEADGKTYYTGYGVLNGVMAHEFGHSLGALDLYNVKNSNPMIGQFDIMDSGGSAVTEDPYNPGVLVEGELPCLPGAFTRELMFGNYFSHHGLMVVSTDLIAAGGCDQKIKISASSQFQPENNIIPNIIKIPLTADEYLLVENRSVDPDNDGGTTLQSALEQRVVLYPTPADDPESNPTYEYDYLLPSFVDPNYHAVGGGLLVWQINSDVIYNQGQTDAEGFFTSNYQNNSINTDYNHRGVKIIEADNLNDLGNPNSYFWTGTPYEYFFRHKPMLNASGEFITWSSLPWRPKLNAQSFPPLLDASHHPSFYGLSEISQPNNVMTFKLTAGMFSSWQELGSVAPYQQPLPIINSSLTDYILPVLKNHALRLYFYDAAGNVIWQELLNPVNLNIDSLAYAPVSADLNKNGYKELCICSNNILNIIEFAEDAPEVTKITPAPISPPVFAGGKLYGATLNAPHQQNIANSERLKFNIEWVRADKLAASDSLLLILYNKNLILMNLFSSEQKRIPLPEDFTLYEPIIVKNEDTQQNNYFLISDKGNIYSSEGSSLNLIFTNSKPKLKLTNLAAACIGKYSPCLIFGRGHELFILKADGSLLPNYPLYLEDYQAEPFSHLKISSPATSVDGVCYIYLRVEGGGILALAAETATLDYLHSIMAVKYQTYDQFCYLPSEQKLFWFFTANDKSLIAAELDGQNSQPFQWSGFRNGDSGLITLKYSSPAPLSQNIKIAVFPSPIKSDLATIRIENPASSVAIKIYDVAGKLVYHSQKFTAPTDYLDIQLDVSKMSSGVYIAVVTSKNKTAKTKFAIEK